jgi:hypothetical protein
MLVLTLMWIGIAMGVVGVYMAIADLQRTHHGDSSLDDAATTDGDAVDAAF